MRFQGEPGGEASGTLPNGEVWHVTFDKNGNVDVKDEHIAAMLQLAAEHPDSPVKVSKPKG